MSTIIRRATKKDLAVVEKWLRAEYKRDGKGFYCNWNVIVKIFESKQLFVLAIGEDVVGFVADGWSGPEIVNVRRDKQGMGYGRRLAKWAIASAARRGRSIIKVQCAPTTSLPFWEKMGFTRCSGERNRVYAEMKLPRAEFAAKIGVPADVLSILYSDADLQAEIKNMHSLEPRWMAAEIVRGEITKWRPASDDKLPPYSPDMAYWHWKNGSES